MLRVNFNQTLNSKIHTQDEVIELVIKSKMDRDELVFKQSEPQGSKIMPIDPVPIIQPQLKPQKSILAGCC
jgi:hypothetical protein